MTDARHVDEDFSDAYDGALEGRRRIAFDEHLARCSACTAAFAEYRQAVNMVRALPLARMPVDVKLPSTPPVAMRRSWRDVLDDLAARIVQPHVAGAFAAGAAAVVIAIGGVSMYTRSHDVSTESTALRGAPFVGQSAVPAPANADSRGGISAAGPAAVAPAAQADFVSCMVTTVPTGAVPTEFDHRSVATAPDRPGEELILATQADQYRPGQTIVVYARLRSPGVAGTPVHVQPCVQLGTRSAIAAIGTGAGDARAIPVTANASPTLATDDVPLETISVPIDAAAGSVITLVAEVPAGSPLRAELALRGTLTVHVAAA